MEDDCESGKHHYVQRVSGCRVCAFCFHPELEPTKPKLTSDGGYELRTHAGVDFEISEGVRLCPGCEGDGREWLAWQRKFSDSSLCRRCNGCGHCVEDRDGMEGRGDEL